MAYIPHLDGLRAVALIGVLLFHFKALGANGGFTGVDSFLVLSGFLMTRIIIRDLRSKQFTLIAFSIRRFWRLYPALLVTVLATLVASYTLQSPDVAIRTARSGLASLSFSANVLFVSEDNYFDKAASTKPLLHTWSLSLEEQFYLVWPSILRLFSSYESNVLDSAVAALATAVSMTYAILEKRASSRFFLLPARLAEFAVGGLASFFFKQSSGAPPMVQHVLGGAGLISLVSSFFLMSENDAYPCALYILPVVGTLFVIMFPDALSNALLRSKLMIWIGSVSYSGYLVHWGIYVFSLTMRKEEHIGTAEHIFWLFGATAAGTLAMHYGVERPLRYKRTPVHTAAVLTGLVAALFISSLGVLTNGWDSSSTTCASSVLESQADTGDYVFDVAWDYSKGRRAFLPVDPQSDIRKKLYEAGSLISFIGEPGSDAEPTMYMLGTSYADHFLVGLEGLARSRGEVYIEQGFRHGALTCPLLPREFGKWLYHPDPQVVTMGMSKALTVSQKARCAKLTEKRWEMLDAASGKPTVMVSHRWELSFRSKNETVLHDAIADYMDALSADVAALGFPLVIIGTVPQTAHMTASDISSGPAMFPARSGVPFANTAMARYFAEQRGVARFVNLLRALCDGSYEREGALCFQKVPGGDAQVYLPDMEHLSAAGAAYALGFVNAAMN